MSDRFKLVLIGAGSTVFTQRLVADVDLATLEGEGQLQILKRPATA